MDKTGMKGEGKIDRGIGAMFPVQVVCDYRGTGEQEKLKIRWFPKLSDQILHFVKNGGSVALVIVRFFQQGV